MHCPFCKTELEEMFDVEALFTPPYPLISSNEWRCKNCPYGRNRFDMIGEVIDARRVLSNGEDAQTP